MSKEKAIEKIQYAKMQVASVYACSAIFDDVFFRIRSNLNFQDVPSMTN